MATALIIPPPLPLPLPDQPGCSRCRLGVRVPSVSHFLPVFSLFGVSFGGGAFLAALRPLSLRNDDRLTVRQPWGPLPVPPTAV